MAKYGRPSRDCSEMDPWIRYLIALFVGFHGLVYLIAPYWVKWSTWGGTSALMGSILTGDSLKMLSSSLWLVAGIGLLGTAAAIAFEPSIPALWRPLAIGAGLVGVLSFAVFWDGQVNLLVDEGVVGMILSIVILSGAAAFPQALG